MAENRRHLDRGSNGPTGGESICSAQFLSGTVRVLEALKSGSSLFISKRANWVKALDLFVVSQVIANF